MVASQNLNNCLPGKGVMNFFDEFEIGNGITSQSRTEVLGETLELLQVVAKFNPRDVIDYIQESHARTRAI